MRDLPYLVNRQCGVFSATQAESHGWTRAAMRWATDLGRIIRLRPGVYQVADMSELTEFERTRWLHAGPAVAAAFTVPGALASHSTAAVLRGLPLAFVPASPCVTVVPWHTGAIPRTHVHRGTGELMTLPVGAVPCTSVARTVIDLAREHGVAAGVVPADYALRANLTTPDILENTLLHCRRWPGVIAARAAVAAADARSESPLESLSRLKLVAAGLAPPELQTCIGDARGRFIGRVDFFWPELGVVGEVDGAVKYVDGSTSLVDEKWRQEQLERSGLIVVRWGWQDLKRFDDTAARLRRAHGRARTRPANERRWTVLPDTTPAL